MFVSVFVFLCIAQYTYTYIFQEFHSTLLGIEKNLINNSKLIVVVYTFQRVVLCNGYFLSSSDEFVSLSQLEDKLHGKFIEQRVLYHVHTRGILTKCDDPAQIMDLSSLRVEHFYKIYTYHFLWFHNLL